MWLVRPIFLFRSTGQGSYRILPNNAATTHMSFSDLPLLESHNRADYETRARIVAIVIGYTRSFEPAKPSASH